MQINERWYKGGLKLAFVPNAQTANRPIEQQRSYALQRPWLNCVDITPRLHAFQRSSVEREKQWGKTKFL